MRALRNVLVSFVLATTTVVGAACSDSSTTSPSSASSSSGATVDVDASDTPADAGAGDGGAADAADAGLTGRCASSFGDKLTAAFGRIDGVVYALQMPNDQTCTMPNRDHLIVQVLMDGEVYRMVVNTEVKFASVERPLPAPAFSEGWHTGVALDYPTTLDAHSSSFVAADMNAIVSKITSELAVGDPVSVYATSGRGRPESAHLVHRNTTVANTDGAIVVRPTSASSKFLLFAFANQTF